MSPAPRRPVVHPFLIALFPILAFYAHNVHETETRALWAPIVLALAGTLGVWLALRRLTRDAQRAGLATSLLVAMFFAFEPCTDALNRSLNELSRLWVQADNHVHPLLILTLLSIVAAPALLAIFRRLKHPGAWTAFLNLFALILVALPTVGAVLARVREPARRLVEGGGAGVPVAAKAGRLPDIYYIILDSYARSDTLKDLFDFDNAPFLRRLEQKGFFVARDSTSNYCYTSLSICSSLNGDYLDRLIEPSTRDTSALKQRTGENMVINSLRPLGYRFVTFSTGYDPTELSEADVHLALYHPMNSFHGMLISMTPLRYVLPTVGYWDSYTYLRERTHFVLDHLPGVAAMEGPTFTFAHIVCPHPPFVFGEDGRDISLHDRWCFDKDLASPARYRDGYRAQAKYITGQIERTIDRILAESPEPPIILLQSDHGSGLRHHLDDLEKTDLHERLGILNCYYFPDRNYEGLTDRITPVNSFRVVLNHFFGANLPLREERSYFSFFDNLLACIDVTRRLRDEEGRAREGRAREYTPAPSFSSMMY